MELTTEAHWIGVAGGRPAAGEASLFLARWRARAKQEGSALGRQLQARGGFVVTDDKDLDFDLLPGALGECKVPLSISKATDSAYVGKPVEWWRSPHSRDTLRWLEQRGQARARADAGGGAGYGAGT